MLPAGSTARRRTPPPGLTVAEDEAAQLHHPEICNVTVAKSAQGLTLSKNCCFRDSFGVYICESVCSTST